MERASWVARSCSLASWALHRAHRGVEVSRSERRQAHRRLTAPSVVLGQTFAAEQVVVGPGSACFHSRSPRRREARRATSWRPTSIQPRSGPTRRATPRGRPRRSVPRAPGHGRTPGSGVRRTGDHQLHRHHVDIDRVTSSDCRYSTPAPVLVLADRHRGAGTADCSLLVGPAVKRRRRRRPAGSARLARRP